jgi:hypothetical protein
MAFKVRLWGYPACMASRQDIQEYLSLSSRIAVVEQGKAGRISDGTDQQTP